MDEYALITYKEVNILLEMGKDNSFFPSSNLIRPLHALPDYVEGIANLEGNVSVVVDLANFLDVNYKENTTNLVFLQVRHHSGDFVLKIPLPKIMEENIKFKAIKGENQFNVKIPSARYYAVGNQTYLVLVIDYFVDFLTNELSDILYNAWRHKVPIWKQETTLNAVPNQKTETLSSIKKAENTFSTAVISENIVAFDIGNISFVVEESYVRDIVLDEMSITHVPNSINWIRGIMNYQNESLLAIDFRDYIEINSREELGTDIVCYGEEAGFVINASNVRTIAKDDLKPVYVRDYNQTDVLYSNLYTNSENKVYFKLNIDCVENSINQGVKANRDWNAWKVFFQNDRHNYEETDKFLMGELQSLNALSAYVGKHQIMIPHEMIEILQTGAKYRYFEGFRFTHHNNQWIPSVDLNKIYGEGNEAVDYATIVKHKDQYIELRSNLAMLNHKEISIVDDELMNHIAKSSNEVGIKSLNKTKTGYAFELDYDKVNQFIMEITNDKGETLANATSEINQKFKIEEQKDEMIADFITGMWDKNSVLYLFAENTDDERYAFPTDDIMSFHYAVEENEEYVAWESEIMSNMFYYVQVTNGNGSDKTYQIPASSYLRAVAQDSVKKDNEGEFISLKEERIPILSFS